MNRWIATSVPNKRRLEMIKPEKEGESDYRP
jgi:hypothetical protein